jgi:hypothetical protein
LEDVARFLRAVTDSRAGVVEWQTRRPQKPLGFIAREGSTPFSGTKFFHRKVIQMQMP